MLIDFQNKIFPGANGRQSLYDFKLPKNAKAVIVFVHGYKGFKDWGAWDLVEKYFVERDFGFVKFNFSHNGGTTDNPIDFPDLNAFGKNTYSYELYDLNWIINETNRIIEQECELDIPIYLLGHSRGGGVSILESSRNNLIQKVVSLAGISDIFSRFVSGEKLENWEKEGVFHVENQRTKQLMPHFYSFYQDYLNNREFLDIEAAAQSITIPFLQIHGDMDLSVSISEGIKIADWTDTDLLILKGAEHTFGVSHPWLDNNLPEDMQVAVDKIRAFYDSNLIKNM